jgi:membrane protease YdiL (CAAX protease family)
LVSTVGVGIGEELFFRGYVQQGLRQSNRLLISVVLTVLLFSACHLPPGRMLFVLPLAVWQSFVVIRTGSLIPGILCHAFVNLTGHTLIATGIDAGAVWGVAGAVGVPAFFLAIRALRRCEVRPATDPVQ